MHLRMGKEEVEADVRRGSGRGKNPEEVRSERSEVNEEEVRLSDGGEGEMIRSDSENSLSCTG